VVTFFVRYSLLTFRVCGRRGRGGRRSRPGLAFFGGEPREKWRRAPMMRLSRPTNGATGLAASVLGSHVSRARAPDTGALPAPWGMRCHRALDVL